MANAVIGALRVNLGIDTAQFQDGVKKVGSGLDSISKKAAAFGAAVGAALAGMTGVMAAAVRGVINEADKLGDVADRLGVSVEALQELRHAADRGGMAVGNFDVAFRRFIRRSAEAAQGTGAAVGAFKELGIQLRDGEGRLKQSDVLLGEVADALQKVQNPADKLRLAFKMFDTDGAAMVNVLAGGSAGLAHFREEARNLGIVLSDDAVRGAQAFKDNLDTIGKAKDGLVTKLTAQLLPALEMLSEQFLDFVNDEAAVTAAADGMAKAFEWIWKMSLRITAGIRGMRAEIAGIAEAARRLWDLDFAGARDAWNEGQNDAARIISEMEKQIAEGLTNSAISQGSIQRRISAAFGDAGQQAGQNFAARLSESMSAGGSGGGRVQSAFDAMAAEAARIFEQTRTPLEQYQAQIAHLNELLAAGAINQDTYNRAVLQAQDAFTRAEAAGKTAESTFSQIGQSIGQTFANAFQGLIDGSRKVKDVLADLLNQLARMAMNKAFTSILGFLFPGAGGFGNISLHNLPGFARGGTILPGGAGGIDSQLVAFRKSPNERVDITKPGQMLDGGRASNVSVDVGVSVDNNGNLQAYVRNISQQTTQAGITSYEKGRQKRYQAGGQFG